MRPIMPDYSVPSPQPGDGTEAWASATMCAVSSTLTRAEVKRIAVLAHLELSELETERFTKQLGEILSYFDRLNEIDTTGVPATTHPVPSSPNMRADDPQPSMTPEETMANAPDHDANGRFRVPKVIES